MPAVRGWGGVLAISVWCLASAGDPGASAESEIIRLRAEISRHDRLYFEKAAPEITDAEYDRLKRALAALESQGVVTPAAGASAGIGDDRVAGFVRRPHAEPMLSLDKAYTEAELRRFCARMTTALPVEAPTWVIEPKYDGLAISVTYAQGRLVAAVTRGDGREGDDVTDRLVALCDVPRVLRAGSSGAGTVPDRIELRGEVYMTRAEFAKINRARASAGEALYTHPRNLAVSTLKSQPNPSDTPRRLAVVFYGYGAWPDSASRPQSQQQLLAKLADWGLPGPAPVSTATTVDEVWARTGELGRARAGLEFPTDGAVVKLDSIARREALGVGPSAPRWAFAYKYAPESAETRLLGITLRVGRTGVITPVAELAPVALDGSTVRRATLHNAAEIARRDLRIGDTVYLEKAGEIIPAITGVNLAKRDPSARVFSFPMHCPACSTALAHAEGAARCPDGSCPAQLSRRIEYFASKAAVGIPGLGSEMADKLVAAAGVKSVAGLYRLRREELLAIDGVGAQSADRLLAAIERSRKVDTWRFINGLGIQQVGPATARRLATRVKTLAELVTLTDDSLDALRLGAETEAAIRAYFADPAQRAQVLELDALGCGRMDPAGSAGPLRE